MGLPFFHHISKLLCSNKNKWELENETIAWSFAAISKQGRIAKALPWLKVLG